VHASLKIQPYNSQVAHKLISVILWWHLLVSSFAINYIWAIQFQLKACSLDAKLTLKTAVEIPVHSDFVSVILLLHLFNDTNIQINSLLTTHVPEIRDNRQKSCLPSSSERRSIWRHRSTPDDLRCRRHYHSRATEHVHRLQHQRARCNCCQPLQLTSGEATAATTCSRKVDKSSPWSINHVHRLISRLIAHPLPSQCVRSRLQAALSTAMVDDRVGEEDQRICSRWTRDVKKLRADELIVDKGSSEKERGREWVIHARTTRR